MLTIGALCLALLFSGGMMDQAGQQADETEIHGVLNGFVDAWNQHDAKAFAAVFSQDADFTNWRGMGASGRAKIEEFHAPLFATIFKNSHQTLSDTRIRLIRPDVAAVDVNWGMTGQTDPKGNALPARNGLLIFVMAKTDGAWHIAVMHNLDLSALPPPIAK
jgi:uncharacterized protein (TIGR02246 family)